MGIGDGRERGAKCDIEVIQSTNTGIESLPFRTGRSVRNCGIIHSRETGDGRDGDPKLVAMRVPKRRCVLAETLTSKTWMWSLRSRSYRKTTEAKTRGQGF